MRASREVPSHLATVHTPEEALGDEPLDVSERVDLLQPPAAAALRLGLSPRTPGFHTYVACDPDLLFEHDVVIAAKRVAASLPAPNDVVYVHDFDRPEAPRPLVLPAGMGPEFADAMAEMVDELGRKLRALAGSPAVRETETALGRELTSKNKQVVADLEAFAKSLGFGVKLVPGGVQTFPILHGKPVSPEQFDVLDESTRRALADAEERLSAAVEDAAKRIREMTEAVNAASDDALQKAAEQLIGEELGPLAERFSNIQAITSYLNDVAAELVHDWRDFVEPPPSEDDESAEADGDDVHRGNPEIAKRTGRFDVNVYVTHDPDGGAPVVFEPNPSFPNLFGYLERRARFGTLVTDFMRIRAGSMARASGGYLVLRVTDLMSDPLIWERFKRVLREKRLAPEDPLGPIGMYATTLRAQLAPLDVRVVMVGPQSVYEQLLQLDPDFAPLFRIKVEAEWWVARNDETLRKLDGYIMSLPTVKSIGASFNRSARARLLDFATRLVGDRDRLSLAVLPLEEAACFAALHALESNRQDTSVTAEDVEAAWRQRRDRSGTIEREMRDMAARGELMVECSGTRVGVVNGLSVLAAGDVEFGQPMRITAVVSLGREGVIDVEREAQLGGSLHTKGVAIGRGYLSYMFGQVRPLSLRVQIAFEQSYGEIDGDSASSAEVFAILSALADVGIDQGIAVTGSVNQLGEIQPIGGVCPKIEGFFDIAQARGLTGSQGVMLPKANLRHLVLRSDVTKAIAEGRFHLYAISSVAEGIEVLTGLPAGERDASGRFPAGSVFGRVERRLIEIAELLRTAESGPSDRGAPVDADGDAVDAGADFRRVYDP